MSGMYPAKGQVDSLFSALLMPCYEMPRFIFLPAKDDDATKVDGEIKLTRKVLADKDRIFC